MSTASPRVNLRRTVENHWDLSAFNWKLGLLTLVLLTVIAVLVGKLQNEGLAMGLGLLMSLLVLATSPKESRGWALTRFAVLGTVATYLGVAINSDGIIMAIALGLVCFLASFGAAMNPAFAGVASMLSIWLLMALTLLGDGESPFTRAIYFLIGALIVAIPVVIMDRKKGIQRKPLFTAPKEAIARLSTASPDLAYALLFAAVAVISLVAGLIFTPEHPQWTASTAVLLMPAVGGGSFVKTVQRVVGVCAREQAREQHPEDGEGGTERGGDDALSTDVMNGGVGEAGCGDDHRGEEEGEEDRVHFDRGGHHESGDDSDPDQQG
ncbi:MAG: hypothetical protein ACKOCK_08165, partial [Chloroflexota bacterium]